MYCTRSAFIVTVLYIINIITVYFRTLYSIYYTILYSILKWLGYKFKVEYSKSTVLYSKYITAKYPVPDIDDI